VAVIGFYDWVLRAINQ